MGSHVKYKHDSFVKRVSRVNPNMIRTRLTSTYDLFINRLVVSCSQVVSNFVTPIDMVELEERLYIYIYISDTKKGEGTRRWKLKHSYTVII